MHGVEPELRVFILAGGIGSRFWPASRPIRPKPLLGLGPSGQPLLAEALARGRSVAGRHPVILAGAHLWTPFSNALPELSRDAFWIEPRARGTGPVLGWAAHRLHAEAPEAVMVSLHSDHTIRPEGAFAPLIREAAALAVAHDLLLTVAAVPDRPETGYGYIRPGTPFAPAGGAEGGAFRVAAFVEKPDARTAAAFVSEGYLWNTGIFIFPVARFLEELRLHAPEIGEHLPLLDRGEEETFFERVPTVSVDEAVLERSGSVGAVRATFDWDDVGGWEALVRTRPSDAQGNHPLGEVHAVESGHNVVWAEEGPIVLFGVEDLVVVRSGGVVLVTTRARAPELKELMARLPEDLREGSADTRTGAEAGREHWTE